jgi:hypothetical protein
MNKLFEMITTTSFVDGNSKGPLKVFRVFLWDYSSGSAKPAIIEVSTNAQEPWEALKIARRMFPRGAEFKFAPLSINYVPKTRRYLDLVPECTMAA